MDRRTLIPIVLFAALLWSAPAVGHGDLPLAENFTGLPSDDGPQWVLKANFGLITSDAPNRYVCEEAFSGGAKFGVAPLDKSTWVVFTEEKVVRTTDGCDFEKVRDLPKSVADWAVHRSSGKVAFVLNGDAGSNVWVSDDEGKSFQTLGIDTTSLQLTGVDFNETGQIVVSSYYKEPKGDRKRGDGRLLVPGANTPAIDLEGFQYTYLLDVRGQNVLWLGRKGDAQKIVWGTFAEPNKTVTDTQSWPNDATISPDGSTVWVAGVEADANGFLRGDVANGDVSFEMAHAGHTGLCVGYASESPYFCATRLEEGSDLQRRKDDGSLEGILNFGELEGPRNDCPKDSDVGRTCPAVWPELQRALGQTPDGEGDTGVSPDVGSDAGADDAGTSDAGDAETDDASGVADGTDGSADENASKGSGSDDGCSAAGGSVPPSGLAMLVFVAGVAVLRRYSAPTT